MGIRVRWLTGQRVRAIYVISACSLALTGCAVKTPYLQARQWPVSKRVSYYADPAPFRIGVLPLEDERPVQEQRGKRPGGMFLLLWNRRTGDYYTGDHIFGGTVAPDLTQQLIAHLQATNAFAEVLLLEPPPNFNPGIPEHISRFGRDQVVDYLLRGEIQHFFGSQSQNTYVFLLPLYFVNTFGWQDYKSLPWGKTAIQFTLSDGRNGDMVWRRFIEADWTMPKDTDAMSTAALESFVKAANQLAIDLRGLPLQQIQLSSQQPE